MSTADARQSADGATHIAVIGLACRFPGARDPEAFWHNLLNGTDSITRLAGPQGVAARGLLEDPEWFDADYFGISPREARVINPQQRIFLECAVEALENAGCDPVRHSGAVGVYAGAGENAYAQTLKAGRAQLSSMSDWEIRVANGPDFLCSRVAHKLGLRGPAVAVQAACATSLVAVHLAIQGLLNGDCDLALAGGVTVRVPSTLDSSDEVGILSPDGVCRAFDTDARGIVGGDGAGVVVLKRLAEAVADGDRVDAVIRGSAVNNDGGGGIGFTAPGVDGQASVIASAQRAAGVDARSCTYVETHGTGTPLGDPVEIAALTKAFRRTTDERGFCGVGSVKTNIGHTDAAAGIAGLIKTVLALKHGVIPPSLHFATPNPQIDFEASPFRVITQPQKWKAQEAPLRAGVSAFSVGGNNAHVVLEQAPRPGHLCPQPSSWQLLPLSARAPAALTAATDRLADHLRANPGTPLADVAWTLQTGRREHGYRRFALVDGAADAVRVLAGEQSDRCVTAPQETGSRPLIFRFPGVDSRMEHDKWARLYEVEPVFRRSVDDCGARAEFQALAASLRVEDDTIQPGHSVRSTSTDTTSSTGTDDSCTLIAFAGWYASARMWSRWGVEPAGAVGEGFTALVAAAVAGVFEPTEAARLAVMAFREPEAVALEQLIRRIGPRAPAMPLWTGDMKRVSSAQVTDPAYWAACLRQQSRTAHEVPTALPDDTRRVVLDVEAGGPPADEQTALRMLGDLWLTGARIDWSAVHEGRSRRVALPTYPFERRRYIVEVDEPSLSHAASAIIPAPTAPSPEAKTLDVITALFSEFLELPDIEPDESFFDLGGDSLMAARFVAQVREVFPVDLVPRNLFEAPTAVALATLIDDRMTAEGTR
ncbi:type I polyketide synthase [Streptomyces sp. NBC_01614]|uniref:type I polyketide synthase n=1 Tax=Streptomyces sp. NBC_01614 TaxID=2975897 RepID=UPI003867E680